jgi:DNA-binding GntR family transcriptional regulator
MIKAPRHDDDRCISSKSLTQQVVERLESDIIEGRLRPGQRLVETSLCEAWNISRSPVREALRILTGEGFLALIPRKGTFVSLLTRKEVEDIYHVRANLESLATFFTVRRGDPSVVKKMRAVQDALRAVVEREDATSYRALNLEFHNTVTDACGNEYLIRMLHSLEKHIQRYRFRTYPKRGFPELIANHERIIELVASGDAELAEKERKARILSNIPLLLEQFPE